MLAAAAPGAAQAPADPPPAASVVLRDFVIARAIQNLEPQGAADEFPATQGGAYAFIRVDNNVGRVRFTFVWMHDGAEVKRATKQVDPAPGWRTYDFMRLAPGAWKVVLLLGDAPEPVAERAFVVK